MVRCSEKPRKRVPSLRKYIGPDPEMTQILEISDRDFKITVSTLEYLVAMVYKICEKI